MAHDNEVLDRATGRSREGVAGSDTIDPSGTRAMIPAAVDSMSLPREHTKQDRLVAMILAPCREAVSGVSTHLDLLLRSKLAEKFTLVHFQVGSEGRKEGRLRRLLRLTFSPFLLATGILRRNAGLVHLNTSLNGRAYFRDLVYLVVSKACGARVLYQVHGGAFPDQMFRTNRILTAFLRLSLLLPDAIVVLGEAERDAYRSFVPGQKILKLSNCIDCRPYARLLHGPSDSAIPLKLLYMGRLAGDKGLQETLHALRIVRDAGVDAKLVIAGSGPHEASLRRLAADLGIAELVSFPGAVFGSAKSAVLGAADVLVLASHAEGLPYALLEGMAAGLPAIVTRVGAIPDVVADGIHGIFVPVRDQQAIAAAIARLAADRERVARMGASCSKRISGEFSIDRLSEEFGRLYAELLTAKRPAPLS